MTMRSEDYVGKVYGHLTVLCLVSRFKEKTKFKCKCVCGKIDEYLATNVKRGNSTSCGCMKNVTHGMTGTQVYKAWRMIHQRCYNPKAEGFENYGGRGITVSEAWESFDQFYTDMGDPPKGTSIERLDVNGNYEKHKSTGELQCVWATAKEQHRNRRDNHNITAFGKTQCLTAWAEEYNLPVSTLKNRLVRAKMKPEDALQTPVLAKRRKVTA